MPVPLLNIPGDGVTLNTTGGGNGKHTARPWEFNGVNDKQDIEAGQFVRFIGNGIKNAFIKPMRCYLSYVGTNNARGMNRAAETEELPQTITVRLISANGDTTDIGTIDTRTGEFTSDGWYDMNGRKLNGKPTRKGLYIHDNAPLYDGEGGQICTMSPVNNLASLPMMVVGLFIVLDEKHPKQDDKDCAGKSSAQDSWCQ